MRPASTWVQLTMASGPAGPVGPGPGGHWGTPEPTAVQTSGLTKHYGKVAALNDCTISVPEGRISALIGPNGAGKTNLGKDISFRGSPVDPAPPATIRAGGAGGYRCLAVRAVHSGTGRPSVARDVTIAVSSRLGTTVPAGGERFTARPAAGSSQAGSPHTTARQRKRRAGGVARRDEDALNAYVKKAVDALPPLTDAQRDLLALIFRNRHK
jgi:hypothetical protein